MLAFSANLGFLFSEHTLPDAIRAAAQAGFQAVECQFPYDVPAADVRAALDETGLPMLGLNTSPGQIDAGDFGLAALPDREAEARVAIDQAVAYADAIGCRSVHVMAGKTGATDPHVRADFEPVFQSNLDYACRLAAPLGVTILIEPINRHDVPGYHLYSPAHAARTIAAVGQPNLKMMLDCYHVTRMGGDPLEAYRQHAGDVHHIQFAGVPERGVPERGDPGQGEVDYAAALPAIRDAGYDGFPGAEHRPAGTTADSLGWLPILAEALSS